MLDKHVSGDAGGMADRGGGAESARYVLRLYVTGATPRSSRAIRNIKRICEDHLPGRYDLEVVDLFQQPMRASHDQVVAAPTLVISLPQPLRRFIGDLSDSEHVLTGLNLQEAG